MTALRHLGQRLAASLVTLAGVSMLIFIIARVIPGDPARIALGPDADNQQVAQLRERLGLDRPVPVQYLQFLEGVAHGDLGISLYTNAPVSRDIAQGFPATFELILVSSTIMICFGLPLGVLAAAKRDRAADHVTRLVALLGVVTPSFVWAVLLMLLFSDWLGWLPIAGRLSEDVHPPGSITGLYLVDSLLHGNIPLFLDALSHIALPAIALSLAGCAQAMRLTRTNVVEAYGKPYIEMARAYGLAPRRIAMRYALRPALTPSLTILGLDVAAKLGSAFLVETVFGWPGMASYGVQAILHKDLNGIVGTVLVISAFFLVINMIVDLLVTLIDPRIRLAGRA
jgi:peptide/nickel transport system permease protein